EIEMTRRLVAELAPDDIGVSVSYPLPGTGFFERVSARLGEKRNWRESGGLDPLFSGLFPRDFYQTLSRTLHAAFRARRGWRELRALAAEARAGQAPAGAKMQRGLSALRNLAELPIWIAGNVSLRRRRAAAVGTGVATSVA